MSKQNGTCVRQQGQIESVPKACGADIELGNFILGSVNGDWTCWRASRALLREISGIPHSSYAHSVPTYCNTQSSAGQAESGADTTGDDVHRESSIVSSNTNYNWSYNSQDWGRKYLASNGGSAYIDLQHLELCLPEVLSAYDYVAVWHAMLRIAREALYRANDRLSPDQTIEVLVNNTDSHGRSYGSHNDFLVTRSCWDNLFHRKLHYMLYLASHFASSIVYTGAGKVGSDNGRPPVEYQIDARADYYETITSERTTSNRPIVNSRDESLCGSSTELNSLNDQLARLHVIFFDNTLCHVSSLLKTGVTQIVLAMIEQEHVDPSLILDDPLRALLVWSHDRSLRAKAKIASGVEFTVVELQLALLEKAHRFVDAGKADHIVPQAHRILEIWSDTLEELERWDVESLAGKLDWVLKYCILTRAIEQNGFSWDSPEIKHLDHLYSNLDPSKGLYWAYERSGLVKKVVPESRIEHFIHEPPEDTRAWLRAHILRKVNPESISAVDWDVVRFRFRNKLANIWPSYSYYTLPMNNPLSFTRDQCQQAFESTRSLKRALRKLGMRESG